MGDWTKWALGIVGGLFLIVVVAAWRLVAGKSDKADVDRDFANVNKNFELLQAEGLRQYRELRTAIEVIQKELTLLDKHSLTNSDLTEMKSDIKELVKGVAASVKLIDGMPERLSSLEATRNKQSER